MQKTMNLVSERSSEDRSLVGVLRPCEADHALNPDER